MNARVSVEIPGWRPVRTGKVRELFDIGSHYVMIATDRISAFDCILPTGIPNKGRALTELSQYWFQRTQSIVENHWVPDVLLPEPFHPYAQQALVCEKLEPIPIECVVRGYLAGSGWKEYQESGAVCGVVLPSGLRQAEKLESPVFTPATKAESGHDENVPFEALTEWISEDLAERIREISIALYKFGAAHAEKAGILLADTKFEFGRRANGDLVLMDEVLTPDSSRFWPKSEYRLGVSPSSFDKQFVRDYLLGLEWDRCPPAPSLPDTVVSETERRYLEALDRLTRPL